MARDSRANGELAAPDASAEEAAAIVAALERFVRDTAATRASGVCAGQDQWRRAALIEGVMRRPALPAPEPWING